MPCRIQNMGVHHLRLDLRGGRTIDLEPRQMSAVLPDEIVGGSSDLLRLQRQGVIRHIAIAEQPPPKPATPLDDVKGIGPKTLATLREGGIERVEDLAGLSEEVVSKLLGGSRTRAKKIVKSARDFLRDQRG